MTDIKKAIEHTQAQMKAQYDKYCCNIKFEVGDRVLILTKEFLVYKKNNPSFIVIFYQREKITTGLQT